MKSRQRNIAKFAMSTFLSILVLMSLSAHTVVGQHQHQEFDIVGVTPEGQVLKLTVEVSQTPSPRDLEFFLKDPNLCTIAQFSGYTSYTIEWLVTVDEPGQTEALLPANFTRDCNESTTSSTADSAISTESRQTTIGAVQTSATTTIRTTKASTSLITDNEEATLTTEATSRPTPLQSSNGTTAASPSTIPASLADESTKPMSSTTGTTRNTYTVTEGVTNSSAQTDNFDTTSSLSVLGPLVTTVQGPSEPDTTASPEANTLPLVVWILIIAGCCVFVAVFTAVCVCICVHCQ